ncbi:hypothetical protein OHC51_21800 [Stenotrophomonas indicatrix]|uniref:hypothetical protein n=1 Tax=Stenotrophomonas indicatrix TaxID=2045451 RepID=UPI003009780E
MNGKMHREHGLSFLDFIFGLLIVAGLAYVLVVGPWIRDQKIADLRAQPPVPSIEARKLVALYETKPTPVAVPTGEYVGHIDLGGQMVPITYYFGANSVLAVEATIKGSFMSMRPKVTLAGSAPYTFTGSVLVFGDVTGDKVLFSPLGLPIDIKSAHQLVIRSGGESVTLNATQRQEK